MMKKDIVKDEVFYSITWSEERKYEKYDAMRFLPELAGIISIEEKHNTGNRPLLFYACWRDGLRVGLRKLMDPLYTEHPGLLEKLDIYSKLYYCYTVVDSSPVDMKDILFWLIRTYNPELNSPEYRDSGRYKNISVEQRKPGGRLLEVK